MLTLCRLPDPVEFPHDCIEVLRCRPFRFSARSCDRWALGRVILCGDAAHVFPPCRCRITLSSMAVRAEANHVNSQSVDRALHPGFATPSP